MCVRWGVHIQVCVCAPGCACVCVCAAFVADGALPVRRARARPSSLACVLPNCREIVLGWRCFAAMRVVLYQLCCGCVDMRGLGSDFARRSPKRQPTTRGDGHGYKDREHDAYSGGQERTANCQSKLHNLKQVLHPAQGPSSDLYMTSHRLPAPSPGGGSRYG